MFLTWLFLMEFSPLCGTKKKYIYKTYTYYIRKKKTNKLLKNLHKLSRYYAFRGNFENSLTNTYLLKHFPLANDVWHTIVIVQLSLDRHIAAISRRFGTIKQSCSLLIRCIRSFCARPSKEHDMWLRCMHHIMHPTRTLLNSQVAPFRFSH